MGGDSIDGRTWDSSDSETFPQWSRARATQRRQNKVPSSPSTPSSVLLLSSLLCLLVILLISSVYLVVRLGYIQDRMEEAAPQDISDSHLRNWQNIISSR